MFLLAKCMELLVLQGVKHLDRSEKQQFVYCKTELRPKSVSCLAREILSTSTMICHLVYLNWPA